MGMLEKFEASLQTLRGPNVDITMEAQEIQVLQFITYTHNSKVNLSSLEANFLMRDIYHVRDL